jgi:RNA methyltransferase, TrmH family
MHENKYPVVTHPRDPRYLSLRSLQTPQGRSRTGCYIIEGIRHLARAVEEQAPFQSVFLDPSVLSNPFGQKLARRLRKRGVPGVRLSRHLYRDLTLAAEPQGIGAVVRQHWTERVSLQVAPQSLWLAVESIDSPGNLGTIIRTGEAAGVAGIFILGSECDPYDPGAVRASMGSLFSQKLIDCTAVEFTDWARSNGVKIVGSSPTGLLDYKALRCRWPGALVIGSEKRGLSTHFLGAADFIVRIPMRGRCDSINVAVAAGVLLFEMSSQRRGRTPVYLSGVQRPT